MRIVRNVFAALAALLLIASCGSDQETSSGAGGSADRPVVVATTGILGDVIENLVGGQVDVVTIMPVGADPHDFQPSAQDVAEIERASAIVVNGAAFEEGLLDAVEAAEASGVPVFEAITAVTVVESSDDHDDDHGDDDHDDDHGDDDHDDDHDDDDDDDDDHGDDDHDDDDDHGDDDHDDGDHEADEHHDHAGGLDPHFFTDPARMAVASQGIVDFLVANVAEVDADELRASADDYISTLNSLDQEVETILAEVSESQRVLVTNHDVFGYFADRYNFEVIGTVVPTGSSTDGVSGRRLADLTELLEAEGVSVVFTDSSASDELAQTLATEVGDVAVVPLFTESLGDPDSGGSTYVDMVRSNARGIAVALEG